VSNVYLRRLPVVIAETDELKALLMKRRGLAADRIEVVGLGVDHGLFRPMDQASARRTQGISTQATVLLYVGAMDEYHDLEPVIEALGRVRHPSLELHVVGEGEYRARCEAMARAAGLTARFHGHVPHARVPEHIAAADLCLAPYRTSAFWEGLVTFSTLKVPEYMACGRPVVGVPSGPIRKLIDDGVSGFLFPNDVSAWVPFLSALPSREQLALMGQAAARAVESVAWSTTARRYLEICETRILRREDAVLNSLPQTDSHGR
jgi:glycosyltransferase involved in cell wall biosynthesis